MALLAHLYPHIKGSQEDIATLSLQYILSQSNELNHAFTRLLAESLHMGYIPELHYNCQRVGEQRERPDMSGVDETGKEIIICEAKFYAGLTENQPNTYLERLRRSQGAGLVFICPTIRKSTLWAKLLSLINAKTSDYFVDYKGIGMAIVTWAEIMEMLFRVGSTYAITLLPDITELNGFCAMMDDTSFLPFSPEDMGPIKARLEMRYYQVVDSLANELLNDKSLNPQISESPEKAAPYRDGYSRKATVCYSTDIFKLTIYYDRNYWIDSSSCETPFWLLLQDSKKKQPEAFLKMFNKYPLQEIIRTKKNTYLALHALQGEPLDVVARDMKAQVIRYLQDMYEEVQNI